MDNYERYRFQDFPWLDKDYDQVMEFLRDEKGRQLGVYLQNKQIGPDKLKELLDLATENGFLQALLLDKNNIGDEGCEILAEYLSKDTILKYLFLENNNISDKGVKALIDGLKQNKTLKSIWLGRNQITDHGVEDFSNYLLEYENIKEFSVGGERMTDDGAFCIARALNSNDNIKSVHLLDNKVDFEGARLLAEIASNHDQCEVVEVDGKYTATQFSELMRDLAAKEKKLAFEQAVINGEEGPWLRSKIMVVGQGRAGKTATVRSMLNLPFEPNLASTIGAAITTSTTKKNPMNKWEKDNNTDQQVDLAVDAASRLAVLKMRKRRNDQESAFAKKSLKEMREHLKKLRDEEEARLEANKKAGNNVIPKDIQEEINQKFNATLVTNKSATLEDIAFTIWDYGGQKVFYTLHHLFLTKYGLYLLAFDMRDVVVPNADFSEKGYKQKKLKQKECREYIEFWLNSVYMHASEAPILIIGTYLDAVGEVEHIQEVNHFIREIVEERFGTVIAKNNNLWFFPLSNPDSSKSIKDLAVATGGRGRDGVSNIDTIRDTIEETARKQEFVNQKLSLRWIKCLDLMLQRPEDFIRYNDALAIATTCGIQEQKEVDNLLGFFHELGMIVHLDSTQHLKEIVTIKPQWLITELAKVIRDKKLHAFNPNELKRAGLTEMYDLVKEKCIVTRDWLEYLWPKERVDFLIDLMKRTMLISDWKFGEFSEETAFLVPSLIEVENKKAALEVEKRLIQFKDEEETIDEEIKRLKEDGFFDDTKNKALRFRKFFPKFGKNAPNKELKETKELVEPEDMKEKEKEEGEAEEAKEVDEKEEMREQVEKRKEEKEEILGFYEKNKEADGIVFDFRKSFLPNGVFQRLLCLCILKCSSDKTKTAIKEPKLFKEYAEIDMGEGQLFRLFQYEKQILCRVEKDHLLAYKMLLSMMEKLKADVMGKGLEWATYLETVDTKDETKEGVFHSFLPFKDVKEKLIEPWFKEGKNEDELLEMTPGIELEEFIRDISNF